MGRFGRDPNHILENGPTIYGEKKGNMENIEETTARVLSQGYPHFPFDVWGVWGGGVKWPKILWEEASI